MRSAVEAIEVLMNKTLILIFLLAVVGFVGLSVWKTKAQVGTKETLPVVKTDAQWKEELPPEAYRVLRHHATEAPNSSPLNAIKSPGEFVCAGCGQLLFLTEHKFESGTGWPSFFQPANDGAIGETRDFRLVIPRTEVHCSSCGGHLGHVFNDGPKPTGKRYCINGVSLEFKAK